MDSSARNDSYSSLQASYDCLWSGSIGRLRTGAIEIDPVLAKVEADPRRGLTLLIRPPEPVRRKVAAFLGKLRALEPDQYYYHPDEFHITFLSLFTATVQPRLFERMGEYVAAVRAAVAELAAFRLCLRGITASPEAVLLQGHTDPTALNTGRDRLRRELQARGLGETLDARYRLETAHMTVMRFRAPLRDPLAFAESLESARAQDFGAFEVETLELVRNDWYQTRAATEHVLTCHLQPPPL